MQLRADAVLTRKLASLPNVTVITGAQTTEVMGDGQRVAGLDYKDRARRRACALWSSPGYSCRSAWCRTPIG